MTGWLTVIQQMLGRGGLTNCFSSNQLLLLSGGTPHNPLPTWEWRREHRRHIYTYVSVCKYMTVCVCVLIKAGGWWRKRVTVITPCAWCGAKPLASINLNVFVHVYVCVCVSNISRDGDVAGNASVTAARSRQPEPPLHRPRLSPPSYSPSVSLCTPLPVSIFSLPPSSLLRQRQKPLGDIIVWFWSCYFKQSYSIEKCNSIIILLLCLV